MASLPKATNKDAQSSEGFQKAPPPPDDFRREWAELAEALCGGSSPDALCLFLGFIAVSSTESPFRPSRKWLLSIRYSHANFCRSARDFSRATNLMMGHASGEGRLTTTCDARISWSMHWS